MQRPGQKAKFDKHTLPTEVAPLLYIASWNNVKDAKVLKDLRIGCIINVAKELDSEPEKGSSVTYRKVVLDELEVLTGKGNFTALEEILSFIGISYGECGLTVIQKRHGNRTERCSSIAFTAVAEVPLYWLIKYRRQSFRMARDQLKENRPQIAVPSQRALLDFQKQQGVTD